MKTLLNLRASTYAIIGAVIIISLTVLGLVINVIVYGANTNSIILLLGFVSSQVPLLLKLVHVENKVNGNYSLLQERLVTVENHYAEAMKIIPPNIAKAIPPLPASTTGEIPIISKEVT